MATVGCPCGKGGMRDNGQPQRENFCLYTSFKQERMMDMTELQPLKEELVDPDFDVWVCQNCKRMLIFDDETGKLVAEYVLDKRYPQNNNKKLP